MQVHVVQAPLLTFDESGARLREATLVCEAAVRIRVNGVLAAETQCMPDGLAELAVGFLVTAGVVRTRSELLRVEVNAEALVVDVAADLPPGRLEGMTGRGRVASGSGRGVTLPEGPSPVAPADGDREARLGSPASAAPLEARHPETCTSSPRTPSGLTMPAARIMELGHLFDNRPGLYQQTQCVHSAALSDGTRYLHFAEDLGRHSAVDKVIGLAFLSGEHFTDLVLLCSGRFASDMVAKVARVGVPLVISPAAATHEAVLLAERHQITLCGRVRQRSMTVYSAPWRVT